MRVLLTGATGLIGREVGKRLALRGDSLTCLVRDVGSARRRLPFPARCHAWDHTRPVPAEALRDADAVVHLAGEPVAEGRWNRGKKSLILDTRVQGTRRLVQGVLEHAPGVTAFVHGSASGYYGDRRDERLDSASSKGRGFLADVVQAWEAELLPLAARRPDVRLPVVRTGVVLARQGGAIAEMLPVFRLSAGGPLGDGRQWMAWIHLEDITALFVHALDGAPSGILDGVAPSPATNRDFTAALCRSLGVRENLAVPSPVVRAVLGEKADIVLGSTRLEPVSTLATGFRFRFDSIARALDDLLLPLRGGVREREWEQWLPHPPETVWPFFGDANNLEEITPPFLRFKVRRTSTPSIGRDTRLDYTLKLNGVPFGWQTLIESWDAPRRFVDTQAKGPFALWHHTHDFIPLGAGTLMRDTVRYCLPAGWIGAALGGCKVDGDVGKIFAYRARRIDERFGR